MGDHHDFINTGSWWKVPSTSSTSSSIRANSIESGLGLSSNSPVVHQWNQSLLRGDSKAETSFGLMVQENLNLDLTSRESDSHHHHQALWRDSHINNNRGVFLDHQFSSHGTSRTDSSRTVSCQGFGIVDNSLYATTSNSSAGLFHHQASLGYSQYDQMPSTWFLRASSPKPHSPLRFSNNATFWNPAEAGNAAPHTHDASSNFFHGPSFDEQPKNISEIRQSGRSGVKRSGDDLPPAKKAKSEAASPSPAFKVRKEKMGDRIAALQQLVSPFGKTDAASVLSEALEYIKFLHQQVSALHNPYMKSGTSLHHQQSDHPNEVVVTEEPNLRSRGLCLVPVSSTFPVTHDTTVDFWTPSFGGTFR